MKNYFILLTALILTTLNSLGQNDKQFKFKIDGTINADTGTVYLYFFTEYFPNKAKELVAKVKNNKFTFSGYIPEPQGVFIMYDERYMSSNFIIQKGLQNITINVDSSRKVPDVKNNIMINEYPNYTSFFEQIHTKWNSYYQKGDSLRAVYNNKIPEEIKMNRTNEYNNICILDNSTLLQYVKKRPSSEIAFWRTIHLLSWGYEPIFDSIYNSFSDNLKNGYAGKVLNTKLLEGKVLTVGKYFPLIPCADMNSKPFELELFKDNRYTLVDFWYIRCGPCRAQFDKLKDLYSQFNTKGFEIVAISIDKESDKKNYEDVIINEKLIWKHYLDVNSKETKKLAINVFPTNFLIDNTGKIIQKNISMEELEGVLNKSL